MKSLIHAETSQIIKAPIAEVIKATQYENIPKWSKKFKKLRVIERSGNTVTAKLENTRIMGIKFGAIVIGYWSSNKVIEEIKLSDGTITKEVVTYSEVSEGTEISWTGDLIQLGRWTRLFKPLIGKFFQWDVKSDFKRLARYLEEK